LEVKAVEEEKSIKVSTENETMNFQRMLCTGKTTNGKKENTMIVFGYDNFDDFFNDFMSIIVASYHFLEKEAENDKEEIIQTMEEVMNGVMQGIKEGDFSNQINKI
jgi:hypothetical protein